MLLALLASLTLWYQQPAPDSITGWEQESLALGNGWFGINAFGSVTNDRFQVTHNAFLVIDEVNYGSVTDALELRLKTDHANYTNYRRELDIATGVGKTTYSCKGVTYTREFFTSYPDKVMAIRLTASKKGALDFTCAPCAPFLRPFGTNINNVAVIGRTADYALNVKGGEIDVNQKLEAYGTRLDSRITILTDGTFSETTYDSLETDGPFRSVTRKVYFPDRVVTTPALKVSGATQAVLFFTCASNYELTEKVFRGKNNEKLRPFDPSPIAKAQLSAALKLGYDKLKARHLDDFSSRMGRVQVDFGADPKDEKFPTDVLLKRYSAGQHSLYLEQLYFQFGRYLLLSSSRPGTLPANLQGIWNAHQFSPWGAGYWHNINVQMNYWPAFSCNLAECFEAYAELNRKFRPAAAEYARNYIQQYVPENLPKEGEKSDWWCVGTLVRPYQISGPGGHSGPGTGGLTTKLFKDWWDFTHNETALTTYIYPTIHGMADFLSRCVVLTNGFYLSKFSASPEQFATPGGKWDWKTGERPPYYTTVGCGFDQQMIWENNHDLLELAKLLKKDDAVVERVKKQIDLYDPIQIGESGQIKEFREEKKYGEIGEWDHRHISHLVGLYPGTLINASKPEWMAAAKYSLTQRGDKSTGWALAHRLCGWARLGEGDHAHLLLENLLGERTFPNLWDVHPPFQIDGNFGATAGIAEMLVQSQRTDEKGNPIIDILPALPRAWADQGSVKGLCARGAFSLDIAWKGGIATEVTVHSQKGLPATLVMNGKSYTIKPVKGNQTMRR